MLDELAIVSLKRKVHSLETNLLEWRRCTCTFTRELALVLELSDDDVDDVVLCGDQHDEKVRGSSANDSTSAAQRQLRGKCRVVIDLGSQLRRVEQKRKNKTRCELEYATGSAVMSEELMASSTKHCQQFVDQVREFERQAKRKQSIRLGAALAASAATMAASGSHSGAGDVGSASVASSSIKTAVSAPGTRESRLLPPRVQTEHIRGARLKSTASVTASDDTPVGATTGGSSKFGALSTSGRSSSKSEEISAARIATSSTSAETTRAAARHRGDSPFAASRDSISASSCHGTSAAAAESAASDTECWPRAGSHRVSADCESDTLNSSSGVVSPRDVAPVAPIEAAARVVARTLNSAAAATSETMIKPLALSQLSNASDASSSSASKLLLSSKPLPQALFAQRLASLRTSAAYHQHDSNNNDDDDVDIDSDDDDGERFDNRRRARMQRLLSPPTPPSGSRTTRRALGSSRRRPSVSVFARSAGASSLARGDHHHLIHQPHHSHRRSKTTGLLRRRSSAGASATAASLAANLHRLRLREQRSSNQHHNHTSDALNATAADDDDLGNRAELHILMRVEAALRQLEKENALAKEREQVLTQEVQALRDALRVQSAAQQHADAQCLALARESDEWRHVAQRAERAAAQLEDELTIAREEAQLLHSEKQRLKHQNKELLTHVHRLDSLVYGRFS